MKIKHIKQGDRVIQVALKEKKQPPKEVPVPVTPDDLGEDMRRKIKTMERRQLKRIIEREDLINEDEDGDIGSFSTNDLREMVEQHYYPDEEETDEEDDGPDEGDDDGDEQLIALDRMTRKQLVKLAHEEEINIGTTKGTMSTEELRERIYKEMCDRSDAGDDDGSDEEENEFIMACPKCEDEGRIGIDFRIDVKLLMGSRGNPSIQYIIKCFKCKHEHTTKV